LGLARSDLGDSAKGELRDNVVKLKKKRKKKEKKRKKNKKKL
jgi:hypothetical protein